MPGLQNIDKHPIAVDAATFTPPVLACPVCGDTHIRQTAAGVLPAGRGGRGTVTVDADGVHQDPGTEPDGRGVSARLRFICEAHGHSFTYEFRFHKGQTVLERVDESIRPGADDCTDVIWRN